MDSIPIPHQYPDRPSPRVQSVLNQEETHNDDDVEDERAQRVNYTASRSGSLRVEDGTHEIWTKTTRPRGRKARDADAQFVQFHCKDIDDLETNLRECLAAPTAPAEHATIEFHFPSTSAFLVYTRDFKRDSSTNWTSADITDLMKRTAVSVVEVLQPTQNPKDQIVRQKAVARTIVEAIQRVDKFRYSFNNNWLSKEDQAHRFSFFCNDSTLNKGRAANGGAGTEGREHRKPVYECKGFIAVKFSVTKNNLEVHYTHVPLHKTYDERAPLPRRESKRRRMMEVLDPEGLQALRDAKKQKLREARIAAGWTPTKTGRLARPESDNHEQETRTLTWRQVDEVSRTNGTQQEPVADEALQPLLDFLGSAEKVTPNRDRQDTVAQDHVEKGGDDDDVTFLSASFEHVGNTEKVRRPGGRPPKDGVSATRPLSARASIAGSKKDGRQNSNPLGRPKTVNPLLPGMMEGSIQSGNMNWTASAPTGPAAGQVTSDSGDMPRNDQSKQKQKDTPGKAGEKGETEIELLKRRLYETEQRLLRIEAERSASSVPPQPYPPPFYPQYPYYTYPPPPPHYPLPMIGMPPPQTTQCAIPQANAEKPPARGASVQGQNPASLLSENQSQPPKSTTKPATPSRPSTSDQAPTQSPASPTPAPPANTTPVPQWPGYRPLNVVAGDPVVPGPIPVHAPWPAGVPMPEPPPTLQQSRAGALRYDKHSRNIDLTEESRTTDANLKGLFDSAMAAITRPEFPTPVSRQGLTIQTSTNHDGASKDNSTPESGSKSTKTPSGTFVPPRGVENFQVPDYQKPKSSKKSKKSKELDKDTLQTATGSGSLAMSTAAQGVPAQAPYVQPPYPYPYPYPPYHYPCPPTLHGAHPPPPPPPPGYPPYPVQGYLPYPPPPGYGYPPYPPYPYQPAAPSSPPETEAQRKAREQKEKDIATNAPSWATQLRDAVTGYATSNIATPASASAPPATIVPATAPAATPTPKDKEQESAQVATTKDGPKEGDGRLETEGVEDDGS